MHRSAQVALLALVTGMGIALSPVAAQTNPPQPPATPAPPAVQSQCAAAPALPVMPNAATANRAAMDAYNTTYTQWAASARSAMDCRRNEATALRERAAPMIQEFNAANARVDATNTYWTAWVGQMNGQGDTPQACQPQHDIVAGEFHDRCDQDEASTTAAPASLPEISTLGSGPLTPANSASQCAAIPEPAHPPDTEHMSDGQKRRRVPPAVEAYNSWYTAARASLVCRHDEAQNLGGQADVLINEFNASNQVVSSSSAQWRAEVAEFNGRTGNH